MISKKNILLFLNFLFFILLTACSDKHINLDLIQQDSVQTATTPFRESLRILGNMNENLAHSVKQGSSLSRKDSKPCNQLNIHSDEFCVRYGDTSVIWSPKRYFSIDLIQNKTASIRLQTLEVSNFFKTALNNIGKNYKLVEQANNQLGDYRIVGAITGYDVIYRDGKTVNFTAYGGNGRGEYDSDQEQQSHIEYAEITLDLLISRYYPQGRWMYIPNVTASNKLILKKDESSGGFSVSIMGAGVSFRKSLSTGNHLHYATRILAEKSLLEILSKLDDYIYWGLYPNKPLTIGDKVMVSLKGKKVVGTISKIKENDLKVKIKNKAYSLPNNKISSLNVMISKDKTWEKKMKKLYEKKSYQSKLNITKGLLSSLYNDITHKSNEKEIKAKVYEFKQKYHDEFKNDLNHNIDVNFLLSLLYHTPQTMMKLD
ncbi:MAG: Unknown protein [uncultured Sulfurovum sp.]|uniref:Uncharacterized protein n=1 Tax=uncultured Sulfurovum sp. TaxID=269237 RepID=A0A6S6SUK0_9BACT|nr:MAG: Unknown protein [uncultured Sulfurovum sp.]